MKFNSRGLCVAAALLLSTMGSSVMGAAPTTRPIGAREPLTYRDSGIYGWWQPCFWEGPFDFVITQAIILPGDFGPTKVTNNCSDLEHIREWNQSLLKARAAGKRVLVVVSPGQGQPYGEPYYRALEQFLANVDTQELYAITLGEENISSPDWVAALTNFYQRIKKKYPDLPVYQWYTCSSRAASRPGFSWPLLPSDGWISDEYVASPDDFEQAVRRYRMLGLGYVNIIWASPYYSSSRQTSVPFHSSIFDGHVRISQKYNVPTAYFCWDGPAAGRTFPWDPSGQQDNKELFKSVLQNIETAKTVSEDRLRDWDDSAKPVNTVLEKQHDGSFVFRENYDLWTGTPSDFSPPSADFMARSQIRGLRHMRWQPNPSRITVSPARGAEPIDASITNLWTTPDGQPGTFTVAAQVIVEPGAKAHVILEGSANGYDWTARTSELSDGRMSVSLPVAAAQVYTRVRFEGTTDGRPLASLDWIEVRAQRAK